MKIMGTVAYDTFQKVCELSKKLQFTPVSFCVMEFGKTGVHINLWDNGASAVPHGQIDTIFSGGFGNHLSGEPDRILVHDDWTFNTKELGNPTNPNGDQWTAWSWIYVKENGFLYDRNENHGELSTLWLGKNGQFDKIYQRKESSTLDDSPLFDPVYIESGVYKIGVEVSDKDTWSGISLVFGQNESDATPVVGYIDEPVKKCVIGWFDTDKGVYVNHDKTVEYNPEDIFCCDHLTSNQSTPSSITELRDDECNPIFQLLELSNSGKSITKRYFNADGVEIDPVERSNGFVDMGTGTAGGGITWETELTDGSKVTYGDYRYDPFWVADSATSQWVGTDSAPPGDYIWRAVINIPATAVLSTIDASTLMSASAEQIKSLTVNGVDSGFVGRSDTNMYGILNSMDLTSANWKHGDDNLIEIVINNSGIFNSSHGLRIDGRITFDTVIEKQFSPITAPTVTRQRLYDKNCQTYHEETVTDCHGTTTTLYDAEMNPVDTPPVDVDKMSISTGMDTNRWIVTQPDGTSTTAVNYRNNAWYQDMPDSQWIGMSGPAGTYQYEINIVIPDGVDLSTIEIVGEIATDNNFNGVSVNGDGLTNGGGVSFSSTKTLHVTPGRPWVHGDNKVVFSIDNGAAGATGFRFNGDVLYNHRIGLYPTCNQCCKEETAVAAEPVMATVSRSIRFDNNTPTKLSDLHNQRYPNQTITDTTPVVITKVVDEGTGLVYMWFLPLGESPNDPDGLTKRTAVNGNASMQRTNALAGEVWIKPSSNAGVGSILYELEIAI